MGSFNSICINLIHDFAASLGLKLEQLDPGHVGFEIGDAGLLSLYVADNNRDLVVGIEKPSQNFYEIKVLKLFLEISGFDPELRSHVNTGLTKEGGIILFSRFDMATFSLQQLQAAIDRLDRIYRDLLYSHKSI